MEEAQQIAQDYILSLDNLPAEIKFLMEEIRLKELETIELQNTINYRIQRANPRFHPTSNKDPKLSERTQVELDKLDLLSEQKIVLAKRLVSLMDKTCGRLEYDLNRVRIASGELPAPSEVIPTTYRPADRVLETMKATVAIPESAPSPPSNTAGPALKRRKLGSTTGVISSSPVVLTAPIMPPRSSRLSTSFNARPSPPTRRGGPSSKIPSSENGDDAEDGAEDPTDPEDKEIYCTCRKQSYGEMVGCDNDSCPYQWFHLGCVGLKPPLPDRWFCAHCSSALGVDSAQTGDRGSSRKNRKK